MSAAAAAARPALRLFPRNQVLPLLVAIAVDRRD